MRIPISDLLWVQRSGLQVELLEFRGVGGLEGGAARQTLEEDGPYTPQVGLGVVVLGCYHLGCLVSQELQNRECDYKDYNFIVSPLLCFFLSFENILYNHSEHYSTSGYFIGRGVVAQ